LKTSKLERERNPYLLTGRGERKLKRLTIQKVDALAFRQLLISLGLGFAAYVAEWKRTGAKAHTDSGSADY
jgi:hypothetical protein